MLILYKLKKIRYFYQIFRNNKNVICGHRGSNTLMKNILFRNLALSLRLLLHPGHEVTA